MSLNTFFCKIEIYLKYIRFKRRFTDPPHAKLTSFPQVFLFSWEKIKCDILHGRTTENLTDGWKREGCALPLM